MVFEKLRFIRLLNDALLKIKLGLKYINRLIFFTYPHAKY
jgi:hypothetical protein